MEQKLGKFDLFMDTPFVDTPFWSCSIVFPREPKKKQPTEEVFGPDILRTSQDHSCGRPGSKTSGRPSKPWKNRHLGADIHDPNANVHDPRGGGVPKEL